MNVTTSLIDKIPELVKTKYIYLNSANRVTGGDINNCSFNIPNNFFEKKKNQIIKISLNNLSMTKCWYETVPGISADIQLNGVNISITEGSYAYDTLLVELNVKLAGQFVVTYSFSQNKFTFTKVTANPTLKTINCGYLLGLVDNTTYSGNFVSVNPINITYSKIIYVNTNLSGSNSIDNISNIKFNYSTILGIVQIPVSSFDIINYQNFNQNDGIIVTSDQINNIRVFVNTDRGIVPTLTEDFSVSFKIEFFNVA